MEITPITQTCLCWIHCGCPGESDSRGPVTSLAILKKSNIFATPGPDPSHSVGYPVGHISVNVDATLECSWTSLTGCIANGVGKEVSSWGAQEHSKAITGVIPPAIHPHNPAWSQGLIAGRKAEPVGLWCHGGARVLAPLGSQHICSHQLQL